LKAVSDPGTAERYVAGINTHLEQVARLGHSGSPRDAISPGLRIVAHGNYNIYFRVTRNETIIVRVLHSARDVRRLSFHDNPAPPILASGGPSVATRAGGDQHGQSLS
jgi:plasmid stabilization system protein ParE